MAEPYVFDERAAQIAVNFFERLLRHSKGEWAGQPFVLQRWQRDEIIRPLFGWKRSSDGTRRYRTAYIEIPRKNGKSTLCAGIALLLLFADGEPGAEIYSAAADREQAAIVFDEAKAMITASPQLTMRCEVYKRSIVVLSERAAYKVLSADAFTKHGLNAHGVVFDELHAQPNRELWDVLKTSAGARRQPLMVAITTAGYDRESVCWEQHEYARQVLEGAIDDPTYFAYIAAAAPEDDWQDPATWAKANPGLGVTVKADYLESEARAAALIPAYQNTFRRLHLNQWTQQSTRAIDMELWNASAGPTLPEAALYGRACYGGLDLSSVADLAALVLIFPRDDDPETVDVVCRFWCPEERLTDKSNRYAAQYQAWARDGYLQATAGNAIDYEFVRAQVLQDAERFRLIRLGVDRLFQGYQLSMQLSEEGLTVEGVGQGFTGMGPPYSEFERRLLAGKIRHGGHPVLRFMADNLAVKQDPAGNRKPDKAAAQSRIDGIVALLMALDGQMRSASEKQSVYETRGLVTT